MAPRHEFADKKDRISALGLVAPPPIQVQSPNFDGSLATLFSFVRDHKVDLLGVPLFPICEAYYNYLMLSDAKDLDEAAAALTALAYLLERKAWMLLPVIEPEPEYEEQMELPEPTTHEYRVAIEALQLWHEERSQLFFRAPEAGPDLYELPYTLGNVSAGDLARAFERILRKAKPETVTPLNKPRKSLQEQMKLVLQVITSEWARLDALITQPYTRSDAVFWFLALLELIRLGQVVGRVVGDDVEFAQRSHEG
ncbi:MAG: segregation/condensation protein A [Fimbriimonas sp.]|nr:segregation/condensation protein A [Fimbriimonas sp.]